MDGAPFPPDAVRCRDLKSPVEPPRAEPEFSEA